MIDTNKLKCITCQAPDLNFIDSNNALLCNNCGKHYPVIDGVPNMLPNTEKELAATEIHTRQGSQFKYIEHYQQDAIDFDYFQRREPGTEHSERRVREYILSRLPKKQGSILDVGCGKAWVARHCCQSAKEVVSMDIAGTNVQKALKTYPFANHFGIIADSLHLPFRAENFDLIIASEIIEHVPYPDHFVQGLINLLKPGGKLLVSTPYKEKLQYSLCIHCNKLTPRHAHIHSFDEHKLKALCDANCQFRFFTFGNKILIHLRLHVILKYFPFSLWKFKDQMANLLFNSPSTILVEWEKPKE